VRGRGYGLIDLVVTSREEQAAALAAAK